MLYHSDQRLHDVDGELSLNDAMLEEDRKVE